MMFDLIISNVQLDGHLRDIAIRDGKFQLIEPAGAAANWQATQRIDGTDFAITGAFYNLHTHAAMTLMRGMADDLELMDWLQNHIWPLEAKLTENDVYIGAKLAIVEMIRSGTVFFDDMYWYQRGTLRAINELGVRGCLGLLFIEGEDGKVLERNLKSNAEILEAARDHADMVEIALAPHAIYTVHEPNLKMVRELSEKHDLRVHIHLAETAGEVSDCRRLHNGLSPLQYLDKLGLVNEKLIAAHCVAFDEKDFALAAAKQPVLCHMPCSNLKLGSGIFDLYSALKSNCNVVLGTDGAASNDNLSMLDEMKFAALIGKHRSNSVTAITAKDIFKMATENGARAMGLKAGKIATGYAADALLWDLRDPALMGFELTSNLVYAAHPEAIDTVLCAGKVLMQNRHIPGEADIIAEARECIARLKQISR